MAQNKRKIEAINNVLAELTSCDFGPNINIDSTEFTIGRAANQDNIIGSLSISRTHCVFRRDDISKKWSIKDISSQGTFLNETRLNSNVFYDLNNGDIIQFGGIPAYTYEFNAIETIQEKRMCQRGDIAMSSNNNCQSPVAEPSSSSQYELMNNKEDLSVQLVAKEKEIIALQMELANQKEIIALQKEEIIESEKIEKETMVNLASGKVHEIVESELQCTICSDLLIKATTLSCSHTFCKYCLDQWKNSKRTCPICRVNISSEVHCLVIDNFIDKIIENSSEEVKMKRQEVKEERSVQELMASGSNSKRSRAERRRNRFLSHTIHRRGNSFPRRHSGPVIVLDNSQLQINLEPITLSSDLSSDEDFDSDMISVSSIDTDDDVFSYSSEINRPRASRRAAYVEGLPGYPYGGYGYCYTCGAEGHWAPGCPEQ